MSGPNTPRESSVNWTALPVDLDAVVLDELSAAQRRGMPIKQIADDAGLPLWKVYEVSEGKKRLAFGEIARFMRAIRSVRCLEALARSVGEHGYLLVPNCTVSTGADPFAELCDVFVQTGRLAEAHRAEAAARDPQSLGHVLDAARRLQTELAEFIHAAEVTAPQSLRAVR
jgi:hypothetical protein